MLDKEKNKDILSVLNKAITFVLLLYSISGVLYCTRLCYHVSGTCQSDLQRFIGCSKPPDATGFKTANYYYTKNPLKEMQITHI